VKFKKWIAKSTVRELNCQLHRVISKLALQGEYPQSFQCQCWLTMGGEGHENP